MGRRMENPPIQDPATLHAAVLWARYLADVQGDHLLAAMLTDALSVIDRRDGPDRQEVPPPRS